MNIGVNLNNNGFGFDQTAQKKMEEREQSKFAKNNPSVKETMRQISILESEGKFEEAKKLRATLNPVFG